MTNTALNSLYAGFNILTHLKKKFNAGGKSPVTIADSESTIRSFEIFDKRIHSVTSLEARYSVELSGACTSLARNASNAILDFTNEYGADEEAYLDERVRIYVVNALTAAETQLLSLAGLISGELIVNGDFESLPDNVKAFGKQGIPLRQAKREQNALEDTALENLDSRGVDVLEDPEALREELENLNSKTLDEMDEDVETTSIHEQGETKATAQSLISTDINSVDGK